jgi:tetratricopeptide (TPR) repeat protein
MIRIGSVIALLFISVASSLFPESLRNDCNVEAQHKLEDGHFTEARKILKTTREGALKSGNESLGAACAFYLGLTAQLESRTQPEHSFIDRRRKLLLEAQAWYQSISSFGDLAEVVENLGHVYSDLKQQDKTDSLFLKAIRESKGDSVPDLRRSYADLLAEENRWQDAASQYRLVLQDVPADGATWNIFLGMLAAKLPENLPTAIWDAVDENQTLAAQRHAQSALSNKFLNPTERISLFAAIVAALARQHYSPSTFEEGNIGREMLLLQTDPTLGEGARLILAVHRGVHLEAQAFRWWSSRGAPYRRSPLEALRLLLRSLAVRSGEHGLESARGFLELADQLSETPDLPLYMEIAAMYEAVGDQSDLSNRLQRWEPAIEKSEYKMDFGVLAQYHLAMSEAVERLETNATRGQVDSVKYHLAKARDAAERSKSEELLAEVKELESRFLVPQGGGGGPGNRVLTAALDCAGGRGVCSRFEVEVPELFQRPEDLKAGITRWAKVVRGCELPRTIGWRLEHVSAAEPFSDPIRLVHSTYLTKPGSRIEQALGETKLIPQPTWVTEGAWLDTSSFVVVDALRNALLRYGIDGHLIDVKKNFVMHDTQLAYPRRVRSTAAGTLVLELEANHLLWLDKSGTPVRETQLLNRQGPEGRLAGILDWTIVGEDTILVVGNILGPDGSWTSGLVRAPAASKTFEMIKTWSAEDPSGVYYRLGQPYLSTLNGKVYFLDIGETLTLYEVSVNSATGSLRRVASVPGGIASTPRQELGRLQTPTRAADLFQLVESLDVPAGLYAAGGSLFILRRPNDQNARDASWTLEEVDPEQGTLLRTIRLPTSAHHLTVIPGATRWALIQRGIVKSIGKQSISSTVFIPSPLIGEEHGGRNVAVRLSPESAPSIGEATLSVNYKVP